MRSHVRIISEIARGITITNPDNRYLEIGIARASCFNHIAPLFEEAIAIDINSKCEKYIKVNNHKFYCSTLTDYIKMYYDGKRFDLIFIDANHMIFILFS